MSSITLEGGGQGAQAHLGKANGRAPENVKEIVDAALSKLSSSTDRNDWWQIYAGLIAKIGGVEGASAQMMRFIRAFSEKECSWATGKSSEQLDKDPVVAVIGARYNRK